MCKLSYQLVGLAIANREGSYSTQSARIKSLKLFAKQLRQGGYRLPGTKSIKPKHIQYLVDKWEAESISVATIKNRLAHLRWWARKVGKESLIPKSNTGTTQTFKLNIANRCYIPEVSKGKELDDAKLQQISDPLIVLSLQLQREFGLRREESIKFSPTYAIRGDKLLLKKSWTKGGREREIPIRTHRQRSLLAEVKAKVGCGSLIPANKNYVKQLKVYEYQTSNVNLDKNHGLRHRYAQDRYAELTGWHSPIEGGPTRKEMTTAQRQADFDARMQITRELGHSRESITVQYLGR